MQYDTELDFISLVIFKQTENHKLTQKVSFLVHNYFTYFFYL